MGIYIQADNIEQIEKRLGSMKAKAPKVLRLAVNDTARKAKQKLANQAKKKYTVKTKGFNSYMKLVAAKNSNPVATLYYKSEKMPLGSFAHRSGALGPGVYYNPTLHRQQVGKGGKGATAKLLKDSSFKSNNMAKLKWFVAKMSSEHSGVFQRNPGKARGERGEISEKKGLSIPQMIGNEKHVYGIIRPEIQKDLKAAVSRQVGRALRNEI